MGTTTTQARVVCRVDGHGVAPWERLVEGVCEAHVDWFCAGCGGELDAEMRGERRSCVACTEAFVASRRGTGQQRMDALLEVLDERQRAYVGGVIEDFEDESERRWAAGEQAAAERDREEAFSDGRYEFGGGRVVVCGRCHMVVASLGSHEEDCL